MEMPVTILLCVCAVIGVVALETRQMKSFVTLLGLALVVFAAAMFAAAALEVAVASVLAAIVLVLALRWGVSHTCARDDVRAWPGGFAGGWALVTLVAFAVVVLQAIWHAVGPVAVIGSAPHGGGAVSVLREALVVGVAAAAVWAMLRKTGRRDDE